MNLAILRKRTRYTYEVMKATAFATYKEWAAYRSHMAVSLLVSPLFFLTQMFIWRAIYSNRTTITGLTLEQMLTYYGITAIINHLIYDSADWNLQMLIRTGKFLTFMLRPISHISFAMGQKIGHRILALWVEFIPVYLLFLFVFKIKLIPAQPAWSILSIILSFVLLFLINYCIGIIGFWLTKTEGIGRGFLVVRDIFAGSFVPLTLFPEFLQKILFFLPFQFITYVPIRVFIGSYDLAGIKLSIPEVVGLQAIAVIVMFVVYKLLWNLGIKRFTGVGA